MEKLQKLYYAFIGTICILFVFPTILSFFGMTLGSILVYILWLAALMWFSVFLPEDQSFLIT